MSQNEMTFRFRSALHGFNREDVVQYIESSNREFEEELQRLRTANQSLKTQPQDTITQIEEAKQYAAAAQELEEAKKTIASVEEENRRLLARIAELEEELDEAQASAAVLPQIQETPVEPDISEPILPIETVVPAEIAPAKDYTELELAAYRRAEMAERLAKERAQEVYRKVQSVFGNASARLDTGKADLDQLSRTIRDDVDQMVLLLNNILGAYEDAQTSFAAVGDTNRPN